MINNNKSDLFWIGYFNKMRQLITNVPAMKV